MINVLPCSVTGGQSTQGTSKTPVTATVTTAALKQGNIYMSHGHSLLI